MSCVMELFKSIYHVHGTILLFCMKTNFSHYYRELLNSAPFLKCTSFTGNSCIPPLNSTNTTNLGAGIDLQVKQAASQKRHDLY